MTHHHNSNSIELSNNVLNSVVNDSNLLTYLLTQSFHSQSQQQQQLQLQQPCLPGSTPTSSSPPSTASTNASTSDHTATTTTTPASETTATAKTIMPHTNAPHHHHRHHHHHHSSSTSSHHAHQSHPSLIVEPSIPAACASLLSLRTGGRRPHNTSTDGNLPMLTTALTLLEHASTTKHSAPKRGSNTTVKSSGSRFWDTVLPVSKDYSTSTASRSKQYRSSHTPSSSTTNGNSMQTNETRKASTPNVSAEDESAKMNIPCVVCGVRFRKPGHLNMHWRSVHATSADAVYPGKLQPRSSSDAVTPSATTTTSSTTNTGGTKIAKGKGVRPYGCPQCSSRFRRGSDRNRHMRMVHAKIRPFECSQCGSHFGRKSFLEAHISTVHEKQRPYRCHCGAAFGQRSSLTRHARKIHGPS